MYKNRRLFKPLSAALAQFPAVLITGPRQFTATPSSGFLAPLNKFKAMAGKDASDTGVLVCRTETIQQMRHGNLALPWQQFPAWLDGLLSRS
ncbi:MAG: hypothetical protein OXG54_05450 [Gammaproteobacteria bacterium]|nr:hypothetical protein [Gammaproteobacteria bacterium]